MSRTVRSLGIGGILFGACLTGGLGALYLLQPDAVRDAAGIVPETPSALAEIRSTYGGLHVGIAVFLLLCAARESMRSTGLLFCGLTFACAGVARVAGIVQFEVEETQQVVIASFELLYSLIMLAIYRAWAATQQVA